MAKKFPIKPVHPERICWGCDKYCPVDALACGNGSERTQHPVELFGEGWEVPILAFHQRDVDAEDAIAAAPSV